MESSIAVFLMRQLACEQLPTDCVFTIGALWHDMHWRAYFIFYLARWFRKAQIAARKLNETRTLDIIHSVRCVYMGL